MALCGGASEAKEATDTVQNLCDQVRSDLESQENKQFTQFTAISFRSQVVAGTNYFVKVDVGDGHIHLRMFLPLPHAGTTPSLVAYQTGHTAESELKYFEK